MDHAPYNPNIMASDFHLFVPSQVWHINAHGWQMILSRNQYEACCHLLAADAYTNMPAMLTPEIETTLAPHSISSCNILWRNAKFVTVLTLVKCTTA
jgi:hypothetical protein